MIVWKRLWNFSRAKMWNRHWTSWARKSMMFTLKYIVVRKSKSEWFLRHKSLVAHNYRYKVLNKLQRVAVSNYWNFSLSISQRCGVSLIDFFFLFLKPRIRLVVNSLFWLAVTLGRSQKKQFESFSVMLILLMAKKAFHYTKMAQWKHDSMSFQTWTCKKHWRKMVSVWALGLLLVRNNNFDGNNDEN